VTVSLDIVDENELQTKLSTIRNMLKDQQVIVAYSGGVDSSVVAYLSKEYAKSSKLVMQIGASVPQEEMDLAKLQSENIGLPLQFIEYDEFGYIVTDTSLQKWKLKRPPFHFETTTPGIFAVGDVRSGSSKRVAAAVGEGAVSVQMIHRYISTV